MSADLLAAFGNPVESDANSDHLESSKLDSSSNGVGAQKQTEADSWILQSRPITQSRGKEFGTPLWKEGNQGVQVLFDASDAEQTDDDDFGEFETTPVQPQNQPTISASAHGSIDLLGLDDFLTKSAFQWQVPSSGLDQHVSTSSDLLGINEASDKKFENHKIYQPGFEHSLDSSIPAAPDIPQGLQLTEQSGNVLEDDDWGDFEGAEAVKKQPIISESVSSSPPLTKHTAQPTADDEEWEMFEDGPSSEAALPAQLVPVQTQKAPDSTLLTAQQTVASTISAPTTQQRPTNIPPPSTLLQLLPQIYANLSTQSRSLDPRADLAQQTLQSYVVTSRLISGRQLRWKRDTILSQSTRISQAGLKNTGMKLTALDKSSTVKEDQDVQEAISAWQRHAAALNAIMLRAKLQKPPMILSSNMAVRSVNGPGVLTARECCAVCGLKRNERVVGIDIKVEDTFGEFWVEHWGHRDCSRFWYAHESLLSRR